MQSIDKYLASALEIIEKDGDFLDKKTKTIPKVYKGYIASFGTIIKQSGLLPAAVLFSKESDKGAESKKPITRAIFNLLKEHTDMVKNQKDLVSFAKDNQKSPKARKEAINAAIALKLALRTFNIEK